MKGVVVRYKTLSNPEKLKKYEKEYDLVLPQKMGGSGNNILNKEIKEIKKWVNKHNIKELFITNLSKKEAEKLQKELGIDVEIIKNNKNISDKIFALLLLLKRLSIKGNLKVKEDFEWLKEKLQKNITKATFLNYLKDIEIILNDDRFNKREVVEVKHIKKSEIELNLIRKGDLILKIFNEIDDVEKLSEYLVEIDDETMQMLDEITKKRVKSLKEKIIYKQKPFENLDNIRDIFLEFEEAIKNRKIIEFIEKEDGVIHYNIIPLKLVFMENNWYLAGVDKNKVKFFRLNFIDDFKIGKKEFSKNSLKKEYFRFLEEFETPFTEFGKKWKKLVLKVDKSKKHYFEKKVHFPREKDKETDKDGNLIIECAYTQPLEVLPIIKKWLPFVEVIESEDGSVEEELKKDLLLALNKLS